MSVDFLQDRIRKTKNPSMFALCLKPSELPAAVMEAASDPAQAYGTFARELLAGLKGIVPAVRISFSSFALLGAGGMEQLEQVLRYAHEAQFYVLLEAPELWSKDGAEMTAEAVWGQGSRLYCDGLLIGAYPGSDVIKPFLPFVKKENKDLFVTVRTANKSAPELQDLLSGTRLVHAAAADHVNRYGTDAMGKRGYSRVGILAAASSAESLKNLRSRYPKLFFLLDGADYPNANAKNCSFAFDKMGYGAVAVIGRSVSCAWMDAKEDPQDYVKHARAEAERMKRNLTRYVNIL